MHKFVFRFHTAHTHQCTNTSCRRTVDLVKQVEHAGAAWITVHGRTTQQRTEPVSLEAIKLVSSLLVFLPLVALLFCVCSIYLKRITLV